ncbi:unnamed protein product [Bemisia tabaci]|uniref:Peptidase A2 domain-containing protein n=1 Tax=Bemisia tabaci TaxID=7038 RepID=A0A9P0ALT5_BEMTA|nr:unnamed protein product [Bemisia tabaci]
MLMDEAIEFSVAHPDSPLEADRLQVEFERLTREAQTEYLKRSKKNDTSKQQDASEDHRGSNKEYPKLEEIISFLEKEAAYADDLVTSRKENKDAQSNSNKNAPNNSSNKNSTKALITTTKDDKSENSSGQNQRSPAPCVLCSEPHPIYRCLKFRDMPFVQRLELVKARKLCKRCLSGMHTTEKCNKDFRCIACNEPHNTWLHPPPPTPTTAEKPKSSVAMVGETSRPDTVILLATVQVEVSSSKKATMLRGILDLGSQTTIIVTKCARALQCSIDPNLNPVNGISGYPVPIRGITKINLKHHAPADNLLADLPRLLPRPTNLFLADLPRLLPRPTNLLADLPRLLPRPTNLF